MRAFSTLRILPRIGRIAWIRGSRPCLAEPPAESPSTMKTSHSSGLVDWQSASLPGRPPPPSRPLRDRARSRALRAAMRADAAACDLRTMSLPSAGVLLEPVAELVVDDLLHERSRLGVAELGLGLALELRLGELDRDDRGQALADVVAGEVLVLLLEQVLLAGEVVDQRGQRRAEALLVGAALVGVDRVGEGVHRLLVGGVPLHRDLEAHVVRRAVGCLGLERDVRGVGRLLAPVEVLDVVDQAAVVAVAEAAARGRRVDVVAGVVPSVVVLVVLVVRRRSLVGG